MAGISLYSQGTGCNAACADLAPRSPLTPLPVDAVLPAGEGPPPPASFPASPLTRSADLSPLVALLNSLPPSSLPPTDAVTTRAHYAGLMALPGALDCGHTCPAHDDAAQGPPASAGLSGLWGPKVPWGFVCALCCLSLANGVQPSGESGLCTGVPRPHPIPLAHARTYHTCTRSLSEPTCWKLSPGNALSPRPRFMVWRPACWLTC